MTWIVIIKYKESSQVENVSFNIQREAIHKIAEVLNFENDSNKLLHNYDVIKYVESIKFENTANHEIISIL